MVEKKGRSTRVVKRKSHLRKRYKGVTLSPPTKVRETIYILQKRKKLRRKKSLRPELLLGKYGYSLKDFAKRRREALSIAVEKEGLIKVLGKLESLKALNSCNPIYIQKIRFDIQWLLNNYR